VQRIDPATGLAKMQLEDEDDEEEQKKDQPSPEELRLKAQREREEKQKRYDEARDHHPTNRREQVKSEQGKRKR
jgi:hypothetical protein